MLEILKIVLIVLTEFLKIIMETIVAFVIIYLWAKLTKRF
jgi:hypothetical protein